MGRKTSRDIFLTGKFKRDIKKHFIELAGSAWIEVMHCLVNDLPLSEKYCDHPLKGELKGARDCHIKPDLVLIYEKSDDTLILHRLGSHSELSL